MGFKYIGNKRSVSDQILGKIEEVMDSNGGHVTDLMAGTGAISAELRQRGFQVTAVDVMTQAYHHTNIQLMLDKPPEFQGLKNTVEDVTLKQQTFSETTTYDRVLQFLNNLEPIQDYFWKEFSPEGNPTNTDKPRKYFTPENAAKIDALRNQIYTWNEEGKLTEAEYSLLIHDLIMATNDVANIAGTYGHYLSSYTSRAEEPIELYTTDLIEKGSTEDHEVIQSHAEEIASDISCDLCYIDPPYTKRQYAANYHILETLARGDKPEPQGKSGLRPWRDQYSNFCSKKKIRDSFKTILKDMDCTDFLISYSEDGLLTKDQLRELFSQLGEVEFHMFKNKRFKSNDSDLDRELKEYIIHVDTS